MSARCKRASHEWILTVQVVSPVAPGGSQLDVQRCDPELLAALRHVLGRQHGCVRRRLVPVSFHLHPSCHAADRLPADQTVVRYSWTEGGWFHRGHLLPGKIGDVDEGVVKGGEDVADSKHILALGHLWTQTDHLLLLLFFTFAGSHVCR